MPNIAVLVKRVPDTNAKIAVSGERVDLGMVKWVISPYDEIRKEVRNLLSPMFHLVFLKAGIESLRSRDTKGLYAAADRGEITDLIGYSKCNPYEIPTDAEIVIILGQDLPLRNPGRYYPNISLAR